MLRGIGGQMVPVGEGGGEIATEAGARDNKGLHIEKKGS